MMDEATQQPLGVNHYGEGLYNIQTLHPAGTSKDAALRRLRKERPDLHARVLGIIKEQYPHRPRGVV